MITKIFDIQNNKIIPTEHCYSIKWLKDIMEEYSKDEEYLKVYSYLFYMTCPNPDSNPYFNVVETEKEDFASDSHIYGSESSFLLVTTTLFATKYAE